MGGGVGGFNRPDDWGIAHHDRALNESRRPRGPFHRPRDLTFRGAIRVRAPIGPVGDRRLGSILGRAPPSAPTDGRFSRCLPRCALVNVGGGEWRRRVGPRDEAELEGDWECQQSTDEPLSHCGGSGDAERVPMVRGRRVLVLRDPITLPTPNPRPLSRRPGDRLHDDVETMLRECTITSQTLTRTIADVDGKHKDFHCRFDVGSDDTPPSDAAIVRRTGLYAGL